MEIKEQYFVFMNNCDTFYYLYDNFEEAKNKFDVLVKSDLYYVVTMRWTYGLIEYHERYHEIKILPYSEQAGKRH